jgi:hypothetical protein
MDGLFSENECVLTGPVLSPASHARGVNHLNQLPVQSGILQCAYVCVCVCVCVCMKSKRFDIDQGVSLFMRQSKIKGNVY